MKEKIKKYEYPFYFFLFCLFISFLLNQTCIYDDYVDVDPLYGTGNRICSSDEISLLKLITNAFGLFVFGYISKSLLEKSEKNKE